MVLLKTEVTRYFRLLIMYKDQKIEIKHNILDLANLGIDNLGDIEMIRLINKIFASKLL